MELRELQFFVVSVDAGSLSQAAQILYTSFCRLAEVEMLRS